MDESDLEFFKERLLAEETAASTAPDEAAAQVHRELAKRYAALLQTLRAKDLAE